MNDEEFGSFKVLKLKYRRGDQIIYSCSAELVPLKKLGNFKKLRKLLRNHKECMVSNRMNDEEFGSFKVLKLKYRRGNK